MSAATKRKHVAKEIISEFPALPNPPQLFVARILAGKGNNLHLVEAALLDDPQRQRQENATEIKESSSNCLPQFLVSMPVKFRKSFWVKRGDFLLCEPIDEGDKVKAEIVRVLLKDDVRYIREQGKWPKDFDNIDDGGGSRKDDSDDDMFPPSSDEEHDEEGEHSEIEDHAKDSNGHNLHSVASNSES